MKAFSFVHNVVAGLALSTIGVVVFSVTQALFGSTDASRLVLLVISLGYVLFLLQQLTPRFGISIVVSGWLVSALALLLFNPPLLVWLSVLTGLTWLIRSALRYQRLYQVALDGVLNGFALCCGISVMLLTHSLWLSLWSYFLAMAFSSALASRPSPSRPVIDTVQRFQQAHSSAEDALRRLQKQASTFSK